MTDPRVHTILRRRPWRVRPEPFALAGLPPEAREQASQAVARSRAPFAQLIAEPDLLTLALPEREWQALAAGFPQAQTEAPFRVISFDLDLPADLVGFLAAVGAALAEAQVPILAICGYTKDHLMVRERHLPAALAALERLGDASLSD